MSSKGYVLPASILAGSIIIALGLYLGLRSRDHHADLKDASAGPSSMRAPDSRLHETRIDEAGNDSGSSKAALVSLQHIKPAIVQKCWAPSASRGIRGVYTYSFTFDPTGRAVSRAIDGPPSKEENEVLDCLREQPLQISIPPPGASLSVTIPLTLP